MAFNLFQGVETKKKKRTTTPVSTSKSGFNLFAPRQTTEKKQEDKKEPVKPRGEEIPQRPNLKNGRKLANGNIMYDKPSGGTLEYRPDGSFISRLPAHLGGGAYEANADGSMIGTAKDRQNTRSQDLLTNKDAFDRDHIVPVSLGGISTSKTNLRQVAKDSNPKDLETQLAADVAAGRKTVNQARVEILSYKQNQLSANPVKQGVKANLLSGFKDAITGIGKNTVSAVKNVVPGVQQTKQTFDLFKKPQGTGQTFKVGENLNDQQKRTANLILDKSSGIAQSEAYDRSQANDLFITKKPDNFFLPSGNTQPIKDLLRATPRGIVQITQPANTLEPLEQKYPKVFRFIYGDEKLTGYSRQAAEAETQFKKDGYGKLSTPLAVIAATGTAAMDLAPLYAPALRSINDEIASVAKNMGKKEVRLTFKDLQDITSGKLTSGEKFDAFKNVAKDIDIKKALKEGGLDITKQEDTLLARMANNPITKLGEKAPTTYSVPENSVAAVKPKEFSVKQLEGKVEQPKPIVKVAEKPKTAPQAIKKPLVVYRAGKDFDASKITDFGLSVGRKKTTADIFGGKTRGIQELEINPNAKILTDLPKNIPVDENFDEAITSYARENGYDVIDLSSQGVDELRVINPKVIQTTSQGSLQSKQIAQSTDGANDLAPQQLDSKVDTSSNFSKSNVIKPLSHKSDIKSSGKVAKTASDINKELVSRGFDSLPDEVLAKYTPDTKKRVMSEVSEIMEDMPKARAIISGAEDAPSNVKQVLFNSMEAYATKNNDISMLQELASSPIASELSASAQALGASGFNKNPDSVVQVLRRLTKERELAVEKRYGSIAKAKKTVKDQIKKEIVKSAPKAKDWASFIEELKCN